MIMPRKKQSHERPILDTLASNLRSQRDARNLSQDQFADLCGIHRTYLGALERAERNVTLLTLQRISHALNIPVADLLQEDGKDNVQCR